MLKINKISENILSPKFNEGKISFKSKEYHYVYKKKTEELEDEITDILYVVRLMPLSMDIKENLLSEDIRYNIGVYRYTMKKQGSATIKKKEQLLGEEWSRLGNEILYSFMSFLSKNKEKIDVTFDYGIFEVAALYPDKPSINISSNTQSVTIWDEFSVKVNMLVQRNENWDIISKSGFKIIQSFI